MNAARADALSARHRLEQDGWIARTSEAFRHLSPPPAAVWLGDSQDAAASCDASPLEYAGWSVQPIGARPTGRVDARWLDAADAAQRTAMLAGLPLPGSDEAAPFAWAHRALCRRGLRLRIQGTEAADGATPTVWLQLRLRSRCEVDAPLLVIDLQPGVHCVLAEVHERDSSSCQRPLVHNVQVHLRLGRGASLQHLRIATPATGDKLAHHVHVKLDAAARYHQTLLASGSADHLQRNLFELHGARAAAHGAAVLFAADNALEQQVHTRHGAAHTHSSVDTLVLAEGAARSVVNTLTHIAPGCDDAIARQRLNGVATGGQPKIVLRPHLEIHHDQVQAAHGATWGALDEEALFYAGQRGLDALLARTLVIEGMARAVLLHGVENAELMDSLGIDAMLALQVRQHLGSAAAVSHG